MKEKLIRCGSEWGQNTPQFIGCKFFQAPEQNAQGRMALIPGSSGK